MTRPRLSITIDSRLLDEIDALVGAGVFANRSHAAESAIADTLERVRHSRLAMESAKLDPVKERALAEEWHFGSARNVLP